MEDVIQHFASVRAQTAINRLTGAPAENTLRFTRTLRSGLVFQAQVSFVNSPDSEVVKGLARGAAALQYMGTSRTRGLGKVHCRLLFANTECDLTEYVLNHDALPSLASKSSQTLAAQTTKPKGTNSDSLHILHYQLIVKEPLVIPKAGGDPNTVVTRQDIPGSHLWGVAAWNYLQQPNRKSKDQDFRRLFLDGELRFLTAYLEALDNNLRKRLIPIPHSIRKFKESENLIDFAESLDEEQKKKPKERLDFRYARLDTHVLKTQAVKIERNYHHARSKDRRKGRALDNDGNIFRYEAIQAEQTFQGAVLGSADDLAQLQQWLPGENLISIGRSRSAQYGVAKLKWIGGVKELNELSEWDGFDGSSVPPDLQDRLIITTLSPLLSVNTIGHPDACFPECELAEVLGLNTSDLECSESYTRTELIAGYHTHLGLPKQQWPAIAAGSVFIFDIPQASGEEACASRKERLFQLERGGLGLRKGEGYGRVVVNRQGASGLTGTPKKLLKDSSPEPPQKPLNQEVSNLLCSVVRTRCLSEIQQIAMKADRAINKGTVTIPSNSLLERLHLFLRQDSFVESLDRLRDPARRKLTQGEIDPNEFGMGGLSDNSDKLTLFDLFRAVWTKQEAWTENLIKKHVQAVCPEDTRDDIIAMLKNDDRAAMCRVFLECLLTFLRHK